MSYGCVDGYADFVAAFQSADLVSVDTEQENAQGEEVAACLAALHKLIADKAALLDALQKLTASATRYVAPDGYVVPAEPTPTVLKAACLALELARKKS